MKINKLIYRVSTVPQYLRVELAIAKILGVLILLVPQVPSSFKDWVYVGIGITLISGMIAHFNSDDPVGYLINVIFWFILLVISYIYWHKRKETIKEQIQQLF